MQKQGQADQCDVIVVGAGLTGAAVVKSLARRGINTAILEARTIAGGATGRSAGIVQAGLHGHYNWATAAYGRERAREVWSLTTEGREKLKEEATRLSVPVRRTGSMSLAVEEAEVDALKESRDLLHEDGFDAWFDPTDPLDRNFLAALHHPQDVVVDARALTNAILKDLSVTVHEHTEVQRIEAEGDALRVWAQNRMATCQAVVLTVNGYAALVDDYFADKVAPTRSLIFASDPLEETVTDEPFTADYGYEFCRQLPDNRLIWGSWRRPSSPNDAEPEVEKETTLRKGLAHFIGLHFPEFTSTGLSRWSGTMGMTPDGLPLVGQLPRLPQVYFAVGLGGRGLAWSFVLAERLADLMMDDEPPGIVHAARFNDDL